MIYDTLSNAQMYAGINSDINWVLESAKHYTANNFSTDVVSLNGNNVYLNLVSYKTHAIEDAQMEAHQQFVDVMVMIEGSETIYVKNTHCLQHITKPYSAEVDALLAAVDVDSIPVRMKPGDFLVLFPQDAHAPACHTEDSNVVKKIIGKVRIH